VLVVWCCCLVPAFLLTALAARSHHQTVDAFSREWYDRGDRELAAGDAAAAVESFRTALAYSREDPEHRLRLAQALIAADRPEVARTHLLALWERQPGRGVLNLELARLAAARQQTDAAIRFYQQAVLGSWEEAPADQRRIVLLELSRLLLDHRRHAEARVELLRLASDLPDDVGMLAGVGSLLLEAGAASDALAVYDRALGLDRGDADALTGAGRAAFALGQYGLAEIHLRRAVEAGRTDTAGLLASARDVLALDALARSIPGPERARRAARVFDLAVARLERCAPKPERDQPATGPPDLQQLWPEVDRIQSQVRRRALATDADLRREAVDVAFRIAVGADALCKPAEGADLALLRLARHYGETER
jgi:tetratricopeptide (TPR) repeat protein